MFKQKKFWFTLIIIFTLLNTLLVTFYPSLSQFGKKLLSRQPTWYAVHLNNGQVYVGQIKSIKPETIVLTHAFFLEVYEAQAGQNTQGQSLQIQSSPQKVYNLVQWGSIAPLLTDNVLFINRSAVLFWEKLTPDSEVVKGILKAEEGK